MECIEFLEKDVFKANSIFGNDKCTRCAGTGTKSMTTCGRCFKSKKELNIPHCKRKKIKNVCSECKSKLKNLLKFTLFSTRLRCNGHGVKRTMKLGISWGSGKCKRCSGRTNETVNIECTQNCIECNGSGSLSPGWWLSIHPCQETEPCDPAAKWNGTCANCMCRRCTGTGQ